MSNDVNGYHNNNNALRHGGGKARQQLTTNEEFTGLARQAEIAIQNEYETDGLKSLITRNARRAQVVTDIYFAEAMKAVIEGDIEKRDSYTKIFLWAMAKANKAWESVGNQESNSELDYEKMLEAKTND